MRSVPSALLLTSLGLASAACAADPARAALPGLPRAPVSRPSPPGPADGSPAEPPLAASPEPDAPREEPAAAADLLALTARCPAEMALVDDQVCVDRWEASLVQRVGGFERSWSPFEVIDGHERSVRAVSVPGVHPQGYISGRQAMQACLASGKRLCTADEWERACRGPRRTTFPYGDDRRARACNDDVRPVHPVAEVGLATGSPPEQWWRDGMNNPLINQLPSSLLPTGARGGCTNDYGVFDMVGNLHEWIDDPDGTFRGGFYMDTAMNGEGCEYQTVAHNFRYHDYSTGFRCCMDADRVE